jgi:hypothetical protein
MTQQRQHLLSLADGVAGIITGAGATAIYAHGKGWATVIPASAWAGGPAATILIGAVAGLLPAIKAARLSPRWRRAGALAAAVAGTALLAAACAGSSGADTFLGGTYAQSLAYSNCMRSNGVSQFPAPDPQGNYNNAQVTALQDNPEYRNAHIQCASVLPNGGSGLSATQIQQIQQQNLRYAVKAAHCMRAHGITNFPDPDASNQDAGVNWQPVISLITDGGLNVSTPSYEAALTACKPGYGFAVAP